MKKILLILSTISLFTIIITNIFFCKILNTNNKNNKLNTNIEQEKTEFIPQIPLINSNGKLIDDVGEEVKKSSNEKGYIGIYYKYYKTDNNKYGVIEKFNNIKKIKINYGNQVYRGNGNSEPIIPTINKNNGKVINGNEK